ncbi:MAG TPA: glycosyltransferase family 4 protein [Candidatus Eisenbergiella merdipullorum]|uniref:Glycosyltransferase family 4 protein n=1 Tax=Candidatus Eisenbergiella merdipullorum TaxID=2838553 RepID=A0A9D2I8T2_9FIRM|nr:glycosyltransferase family 4 protein [Candidatus Eisenbergiella merdipullorum]
MHIVFVTPEFVTEMKGGGLASYLANISQILAQHGHRISIITLSGENADKIIWKDGIAVYRVKDDVKVPLTPLKKLLLSWRLYQCERKLARKERIDLIQYASYESVGFFHLRRIPSVIRISSDCVACREYKVYDYTEDQFRPCLTDWLEYHTEKKIGNIFGPGQAVAKLTEQRTGRKVTVIESPFYLEKDSFDASVYHRDLEGKKYYLSHSSMSCLKGTHVIAEIISDVCAEDEAAYFVFAGNDHGIFYKNGAVISAKDYILKCAGAYADRVIFLGTLEREKLYPIIEGAWACLMPSRIDNMPNTCIEAMAMGKIVVGTRGAGYEQLIEDGRNGFLVEVDSREGLKRALGRINALTEAEREAMGREAVKTTERFNAENSYQNLIRFYGGVIQKGLRR